MRVNGSRLSAQDRRLSDRARVLASRIRGEVRFDAHDRMLYATDASIYQVEPVGVVIPRTIDDVVAVVRWCAEEGLAVLPRGGGTSLAGQAVNRAVVIDFSPHLDALVAVDARARTARVQPGLVLDDLNAAVAPLGLMFGPDVATSTHATLGGMIGNNSAGAHSVLYGRTVEHVKALDVLLADGHRVHLDAGAARRDDRVRDLTRRVADIVRPLAAEIDARFPKTRRHVNGYSLDLVLEDLRAAPSGTLDGVNLARLFCGSEGTLGVTLEATLGLVPAPRVRGLAIVAFADVNAALEAVGAILETGPAAVELIDEVIIGLARANLEYRAYADLLPRPGGAEAGAVLYVEHFADDAAALDARLAALEGRYGADAVLRYVDAASMAGAWKLRKAGEPLLHGQHGRRKPITFIEDTAVEPARLPEFVRRFRAIVDAHGTTASYYAHASVGCLHIRPMIALDDLRDVDAMRDIVAQVTELVIEFGGALSGEHGDGRLRTHLLERFFGPALCDAFRAIKAIFDPHGRLNPGIITGAPSMTDDLRIGRPERPRVVPAVRTYFRFAKENGFAEAVERCNGAGVCRKTRGGTMCPSYRATRDERHSTRGRGNALRLAITGQTGGDGGGGDPLWNDAATLETLDLCLSCKACKSECPSNVDVARLKAEFLAHHYDRVGVPRRVRAFGHVRDLNRAGARWPRLANLVAGSRPARFVLDGLLGLDSRRSLPPFGPALDRWHRRRPVPDARAPVVALFPDCFTNYSEPHIGRLAVRALETLGYRVVIPDVGCCGRAMISNGLLADARDTCLETADALAAAVGAHEADAIVFCEPSCLSAVTDDWPDLDLGVDLETLRGLARRAVAVEDFVERGWSDHPRAPAGATRLAEPVLVHGHCHQAALGGTAAAAVRRIADDVTLLDAGCCGMAGAFGMTRDHFDLSMRIAELALFPALRARPEAIVVASGTSCRHQVRDGLGRAALHPIEVMARALGIEPG